MNVIRHNHIATYCDVEGLLGALGKKNERSVNLILCQEPLSFVRAERDEIDGTCCEDSSQTWWSPWEITVHGKPVQHFKQNCSRCSHGPVGRFCKIAAISLQPATGRWLQVRVLLSVRSLAPEVHQLCSRYPCS